MSDQSTKVLVVEDSREAMRLVEKMLAGGGFEVDGVASLSEALYHLASRPPEVVLLDLSLPDARGFESLTKIRERASKLPIVVMIGTEHEATIPDAARQGADDYLVRGRFERDGLIRALRYAIERRKTHEAARVSEARYRSVVEMADDAIVLANGEGVITDWNAAAERLFGYAANEARGQRMETLVPALRLPAHSLALEHDPGGGEIRVLGRDRPVSGLTKDGREFPVEVTVSSWRHGEERFFSAIIRDLTERERVLRKLKRAVARDRYTREAIVHGIYRSSVEGRFLEVNPALVSMLGYESEAELKGVGVPALYANPHERDRVVAELQQRGYLGGLEVDWLRKDGRERAWVSRASTAS